MEKLSILELINYYSISGEFKPKKLFQRKVVVVNPRTLMLINNSFRKWKDDFHNGTIDPVRCPQFCGKTGTFMTGMVMWP